MGKKIDLTGQKFDRLTVIGLAEYKNQTSYWRCRCICGNERVVRYGHLSNRQIKSCGCLRQEMLGASHPRWTGCGEISGSILRNIKANAKVRGIKFSVSPKELWSLFLEQEHRCAISGLPICFGRDFVSTTASLDRIDSCKGYSKGNVQWVHKIVNMMKNDMLEIEFLRMCKVIAAKNPGDK